MRRPYYKRVARALLAKHIRESRRLRDEARNELSTAEAKIENNLAMLIGKLSIQWAAMELQLDRVIEVIHRNGGAEEVQSQLPVSLKPKLQYLRKSRFLFDEKWHDGILRFCEDTHRLKTLRTDLIHGVAHKYCNEKRGWSFVRTKFDKDKRNETLAEQQFEAITAGVLEVVKLRGRAELFAAAVEGEFNMKRFRDSQR